MKSSNKYFGSQKDEILEELLEFGSKYRSEDFPNPQRLDCPSENALSKAAFSDALPPTALAEHLLSCSPCFRQFRGARQTKLSAVAEDETTRPPMNSSWLKWVFRPVGALLLLFGITIGVSVIYWSFSGPVGEIAETGHLPSLSDDLPRVSENRNTQPPPGPDQPSREVKVSPERSAVQKKEATRFTPQKGSGTLSPDYIRLDFAKAVVLRAEAAEEKPYSLPAKLLKLDAKLPKKSPPGEYTVSLLDDFGKSKHESVIVKSKGKHVRLTFDLRRQSGPARLCVNRGDEIPDCLFIKIGSGSQTLR